MNIPSFLSVGLINRCIDEANESTYVQKVGAVIFKNGNIMTSGHNAVRSNAKVPFKYRSEWDNSYCAEKDALMKMKLEDIKGCHILVIRINNNGELRLSRPCDTSMDMIRDAGIKKIWFVNKQGEIVNESI